LLRILRLTRSSLIFSKFSSGNELDHSAPVSLETTIPTIETPGSRKFKVLLVGAGGVGKTALKQRFLDGEFVEKYIRTHNPVFHVPDFCGRLDLAIPATFFNFGVFPAFIATIGTTVTPISFETTKGKVTLELWDTAGQDDYSVLFDGYWYVTN
jgi:GTPase SAR1 family protein